MGSQLKYDKNGWIDRNYVGPEREEVESDCINVDHSHLPILPTGFGMADAQQLIPDGAHRANKDKLPWELLPVGPLEEITKVFQFGLKKYNRDNWRKGFPWTSVFGSTMRHLMAWASGEDRDAESGLLHLAHAATNILFIIEYQLTNTGIDDRYKVIK